MIKYYEENPITGQRESHTWYEMREIVFTLDQVQWLLNHMGEIWLNLYPAQPLGCEVHSKNTYNARFTQVAELRGEFLVRLEQTGYDGMLAIMHHWNGLTTTQIVPFANQDEGTITNRIGRCLTFISGSKRKRLSYRDWINQRTGMYYYKNVKQAIN